jgi:hypothetical protein
MPIENHPIYLTVYKPAIDLWIETKAKMEVHIDLPPNDPKRMQAQREHAAASLAYADAVEKLEKYDKEHSGGA